MSANSVKTLELNLTRRAGAASAPVSVANVIIAGWTGRDRAAVEKHIEELADLGVRRPASIPVFYRAAAARLTTASAIQVLGETSSGEVEFVLLQHAGQLWLGVGSDHTDREVEAYDVGVSKQMCDKPIANTWWAFDEVAPHWDRLILRSFIETGAQRTLYQEGSVTTMLEPQDLISRYTGGRSQSLPENTALFCGTLTARGGVRPATQFSFEIEDPVLERRIQHEYRILTLPAAK